MVRGRHVHTRRHLLDDRHAAGAELPCLVGVVAEECDPGHPEPEQHLRRGGVASLVLVVAQREVRVVGVDPGILQRVRLELRVEPDAAALLPQVKEVAAGLGDALDGLAQLRPAVAPLAPEYVAGEALAVGAASANARCSRPSTSPSKLNTRASAVYPSANCRGSSTWVRIVAARGRMAVGSSLIAPGTSTRGHSAGEPRRRASERRRAPRGGRGSRGRCRHGRTWAPPSRPRRPARRSAGARRQCPP